MEHYADQEIIEILKQQLQYALKAVVFSVPTKTYGRIDFGDERLLTIEEWESILEPFKKDLSELNYYEEQRHLMGVIKAWKKKQT